MNDHPPPGRNARRGNALILVSALLVLLTLIAGTFLSRARSQRLNASAMQQRAGLDARGSSLRDQIAGEIAMHLFVRPIDPLASRRVLGGDSAGNRLPPPPESVRYGIESAPPRRDGVDAVGDLLGNDLLPSRAVAGREPGDPRGTKVGSDEFPDGYNFAPYEVRPWTNWPDFRTPLDIASGVTGGRPWWVTNPASTNPSTAVVGSVYGNPPGNPGFGDTRWLRSSEPVRVRNRGTLTSPDLIAVPDGAFFSHWTHLSWLPTPDNGFRLVTDIADIESNIMAGGMGTSRDGFGTPYEQWLPQLIPTRIPATATNPSDRDSAWETEFKARRDLWFNPTTYPQTLLDGEYGRMQTLLSSNRMATNRVLPNFIRIDDPLGIGRTHDFDAEPVPASEEYVDGSPRNLVARTFCDADGDGFTDSFWYLLPEGKERNVRTVVGVSVVDNASMVDLNVATRFDRHTTAGFTPADVAVVTAEPEASLLSEREKNRVYPAAPSAIEFGATDTRVGLLDSWWNGVTGDVTLLDPFGNPDDGNSNPGIPHAFQRSSVSSTTSSDFGQAFDLYRYAGRPLPMDNDASLPRHDDGQSSLLRSLGVWYGSDEAGYWNPLFHQLPEASAALIGYRERAESLLSQTPTAEDQDRIYAPWFDVWGPGTAARPQRSETRWRRPSGYSSIHLGWDSWLGLLWPGTPRLGPLDGSGGALSINQPFMREEERTRWFQAAMRGEARWFGPLNFGGQVVEATGIGVTGNPADGVRIPLRFFGAADELELRGYAGNNDAAVMSRLESSLNGDNLGRSLPGGQYKMLDTVLRSSILRAEGGISGNRLTNAQLVRDLRRKVTTVSGEENGLMPPWLWISRPFAAAWTTWGGANMSQGTFNTWDPFNSNTNYQNATLWLGLHPEPPGPRDENNDGRLDARELQWGVFDLRRITCSDDPYPDGNRMVFSSTAPKLDQRDLKRAVRMFETLNSKFDLRRPLLVHDRTLSGGRLFDRIDDEGRPIFRYALSVPEERRSMIEFARETRQRLRPALRSHWPQRYPLDWSSVDDDSDIPVGELPIIERLGAAYMTAGGSVAAVQYGSYTDRFLDQLRHGLDQPTVGLRGDTSVNGMGALAWRSAWSTEAMTASLSANIATWRSRPTRMLEMGPDPAADVTAEDTWGALLTPARNGATTDPVWRFVSQPILPNHISASDPARELRPGGLRPQTYRRSATDYGDQIYFDSGVASGIGNWTELAVKEPAPVQALTAVDPSKAPSQLPNNGYPLPQVNFTDPSATTADVVFPGVEKHPFLVEAMVAWVYPATTVDDGVNMYPARVGMKPAALTALAGNMAGTNRPAYIDDYAETGISKRGRYDTLLQQLYHMQRDPSQDLLPGGVDLPGSKLVAVVNGRVATEALAKASSNPFEQSSADPLGIDAKRDTLNKIRTPVIVVQVANPYSEPIRLGDYRLEFFGSSYDFPDWEYDDNGNYLRDANGNLVPLYLNPASEDAPSTATVYLIANCLGNPSDAPDGGIFGSDVDGHGRMRPDRALTTPMVDSEADLVSVAMWDPLFRRRWLDFLDLFELTEAGATPGDWPTSPLNPRAIPTSPKANALFWGARGQRQLSGIDNTTQLLPTSKLLSAMMVDPADRDPPPPLPRAKTVADANEIAAGEGDPAVYGGPGAREMIAGGGPPGDFGRGSRMFKRRIVNLRAFRESLTADNLKRGISLHRILRDPSARTPLGADHGVRSTALMKPVLDPLESVDMSAVNPAAPPPPPAAHALRFQMRDFDASSTEARRSADQRNDAPGRTDPPALQRHWFTNAPAGSVALDVNNLVYTEQTLEVDRFDADSDFDHQTTVGVSPLDPDRSTVIDRSLVTGGRFWSAVARITLPPLRDLNPNPVPGGSGRLAAREMQLRVGAHDPANFLHERPAGPKGAVIDAATMEAWHRNEANPSLASNPPLPLDTPPIQQYTFSEPGGDLSLFPPATCRWMLGWVRSFDLTGAVKTADDRRLEPIVYAQPAPPTVGLPPVVRFTTLPTDVPASSVAYRVLPPVIPGIMLGRSQLPRVVTPPGGMPDSPVDGSPSKVLADSNDYFTSWTRVARSWSKLHRSEFTTVRSNSSGPYDLATGPWRWTRQMVNEPSRGFESLAPANAAARTGFIPPDQRAPRFVFASRTEPDRTSNPRRPARFELTDYEPNGLQLDGTTGQPDSWLQLPTGVPYPYDLDTRFSAIGSSTAWSSPALADRIRGGEAVSNYGEPDYATATAEGDVFRRHLLRETSGGTTWSPRWMDPDVWNPLPDTTPANPADDVQVPVAGQEWGYSKWMEGIQDDGLPRNEWLLSPCVAPLPDFRNFSGATLAAGSPTGTVAFPAQWPELILRKPTAFNCETVVWNGSGGQFAYAFYGDATIGSPAAGSAANGPSSITGVGVNGGNWVRNPSTQFVADNWTSPYMQNSGGWSEGSFVPPFDPAGNVAAPRIYMADKGARLVDQTGQSLRLRIDRFPAYSVAVPPLPGSPPRTGTVAWNPAVWTFQGAWNTLDRVPHDGPLQMLQKDDDFEQLGELLDVFAWGPAYRIAQVESNLQTAPGSTSRAKVSGKLLPTFIAQDGNGTRRPFRGCRATFSEIMTGRVPGFPVGEGPFVNRLQVDPPNFAFDSVTTTTGTTAGQTNSTAWQWGGTSGLRTPYGPSVPWAQRVFDAFTLDGSGGVPRYDWSDPSTDVSLAATSPQQIDTTGYNVRYDLDRAPIVLAARIPADCQLVGVGTGFQPTRTTLAQWEQDRSAMLSGGGTGAAVRGRININTAPLEVMRALPHMSQLVYDDGGRTKNSTEQRLLDVPRPGPSIRGRNYTFDTKQGARASWFGSQSPFPSENPLVLVTDAIDIYRQNLDPSQAFTLLTASQWSPDQSRPLEPTAGRLPVMPTYVDRGDPAIKSNTLLPFNWPTTAQIQPDRGTFTATRAPGAVLFNRGMRGDPGFATIGELTTLARSANRDPTAVPATFPLWQFNHSWNIRFAGIDPYNTDATMGNQDDSVGQGWYANWTGSGGGGSVADYGGPSWRVREPLDARLSTDRQGVRRFIWRDDRTLGTNDRLPPQFSWSVTPDSACGDSEEQNLLFKGISNLVTTRSDVFTVYFRVKTVRQDPVSGRWNGVDPDSVLQDSRYVMCVDRSGVKRPTDPPRIVFFSKVDD